MKSKLFSENKDYNLEINKEEKHLILEKSPLDGCEEGGEC